MDVHEYVSVGQESCFYRNCLTDSSNYIVQLPKQFYNNVQFGLYSLLNQSIHPRTIRKGFRNADLIPGYSDLYNPVYRPGKWTILKFQKAGIVFSLSDKLHQAHFCVFIVAICVMPPLLYVLLILLFIYFCFSVRNYFEIHNKKKKTAFLDRLTVLKVKPYGTLGVYFII